MTTTTTATRYPAVFSGHGSPMLAIEDTDVSRGLRALGERLRAEHGDPRGILAVSAHWYTRGTFVQTTPDPRQVYDMYGFPQGLYQVKYPVRGSGELTQGVRRLLAERVRPDDSWGIDHGTWTVLVHLFPAADVPVVQLSVDATLPPAELVRIGRDLAPLRDEGYLVFGSGNVVHNLGLVDWEHPDSATEATLAFNRDVIARVLAGDVDGLAAYERLPHADYAVPTPDHYLPLLYLLGTADGDAPEVFNNVCNLGSMAMTSFAFGM